MTAPACTNNALGQATNEDGTISGPNMIYIVYELITATGFDNKNSTDSIVQIIVSPSVTHEVAV